MSNFDIEQIQPKMDEIVRDYIYLLLRSRNRRQNYFSNVPTPDDQASFYHSQGFQVLYKYLANKYIVKEEALFEGYTRAFLINPIIDYLLGCQGVKHEWHYGSTFSDPYISNRVHELDTYVEFIFEYQGKTVGCRYTSASYPIEMTATIDRNFKDTMIKWPLEQTKWLLGQKSLRSRSNGSKPTIKGADLRQI